MDIEIKNINKSFNQVSVFRDFSLLIPDHAITCILGPSGCGKTTFLNMLSHVVIPDSGHVIGIDLEKVSYIFQETRVLPWKTALENVALVLKKRKTEETRAIATKYLRMVEMEGALEKYPHQMSGGMKQRVAIARAFAYPSDVILMDEPFQGLDLITKQNILAAFKKIWEKDKRAVIYVTHDIDEALQICDRLVVFSDVPVSVLEVFKKRDIQTDYDPIKANIARLLDKKAGE